MSSTLEAPAVKTTASPDGGARIRTFGFRLTVAGAVGQVLGLVIDVVKHAADPTLAAREALLTFGNVGHVLLLAGIGLVLLGVGLALFGPRLASAARPVRIGVPIGLALLAVAGSLLAMNSSLAGGDHPHDASLPAGAAHAHGHGSASEPAPVALDVRTRDKVAGQLTEARAVADRYPTVKEAEADGYRAVTPYIPLIGAHYMKFLTVDGTFDIDQPEMLLYDGTEETSRIVGLSYYVVDDEEPAGFAGGNDHWHRHIGLCIDTDNPFVLGDEQTTEEECERRGGRKSDGADGWMVHAWVVPGWESTQGVFSAENPQLL